MTTTITLDTLKLAERLTAAGFEDAKARVLAETFGELANERLVTKEYLDYKLEIELSKLKSDVFKWLVPLLFGQAALIAALVELVSR